MDGTFTPGGVAQPTQSSSSHPDYSTPTHADLAAVAATVSVVGVLIGAAMIWLCLRLRRAEYEPEHRPITRRPVSVLFRPSFAPSEASSKFAFLRKSLRLSRRQDDGSWDFADPDPFSAHPKERPDAPVPAHAPKGRPPPLKLPSYTPPSPRAPKDGSAPSTPSTPDFVDVPPPAYCRDGCPSPLRHSFAKDSPP